MYKFIVIFAVVTVAAAAPGFIAEHHTLVQPTVVAKTALVDSSASSAITHQSFTNLERKVPVAPVVHTYDAAPVLKTAVAPAIHTYVAAPVVKSVAAPLVETYATVPFLKTVDTPVVHTYAAAPVVHSYAAGPVLHSSPLVKTVVSAPVAYTAYH